MPTKAEQSDLFQAAFSAHGDCLRPVLAPTSVGDIFGITVEAFNLAEYYQTPVIVLSDQEIAQRKETVDPIDTSKFQLVERRRPTEPELTNYARFKLTESGISPISHPGMPGGNYLAAGIEHNELGRPTASGEMHARMNEKRFRKFNPLQEPPRFVRGGRRPGRAHRPGELGQRGRRGAGSAAAGAGGRLAGETARAQAALSGGRTGLPGLLRVGAARGLFIEQSYPGATLPPGAECMWISRPLVKPFAKSGSNPILPAEVLERLREMVVAISRRPSTANPKPSQTDPAKPFKQESIHDHPRTHCQPAKFQAGDFKSDLKPIWCPGCGDFGVVTAITRALAAIGRPPHEIAFVSGIGCSSRIPGYTTAYGFNTVHGRSLPIAQGIKLANPELLVLVASGDGDGFSIGGGHVAHVIRRNIDLTYIVMDNQIYGLTKGQLSPTSQRGRKTVTSSFGSLEDAGEPAALRHGLRRLVRGARHAGGHGRAWPGSSRKASAFPGFAFINVQSPCVTYGQEDQQLKAHKANMQSLESIGHDPADRAARDRTGARIRHQALHRRPLSQPQPAPDLRPGRDRTPPSAETSRPAPRNP